MLVRYADNKIRLIAIPFLGILFRQIGEPAPLITLLRSPTYYIDLSVCILVLGLLWEYNRQVIIWLDKRYSWLENTSERLIYQFFMGLGVTLLAVTMVSFVYNEFIMDQQRIREFDVTIVLVTDIPVSFLIFLCMHLLYTILNIRAEYEAKLQRLQQQYATPDPDLKSDIKTEASVRNIMAYQGKALVPVSLKEIAYLHKANELTLLRTFAGKEYLLDETLEYFEKTLPNGAFFRLNRQLLAHISAVKSFLRMAPGVC